MQDEANTVEDFASLLTAADHEQPETDSQSDAPEEVTDEQEAEAPEVEETEDTEAAEQPEKPDSGAIELTFTTDDGQEVKVTAAEALEAYKARESMQRDYTQKTQRLAQEREQVARHAQEQFSLVQAFAEDIGAVQAISQRLAQFDSLDWNALIDSDPVQAMKLQSEYNGLRQKQQAAAQALAQKQAVVQQQQGEHLRAQQQEVWAHMKQVKPDFSPDTLRAMFKDAEQYGFSFEELNMVADKRMIHMWADLFARAQKQQTLEKAKPDVMKKVAAAPSKVTKPAAGKPVPNAFEKTVKRLDQTKSMNDFAAALAMTRS